MKSTIYSLSAALVLLLAACGDDRRDAQPPTPTAPANSPTTTSPSSTSPSASGSQTAPFSAMENMPPECDMDTSQMTDEERRHAEQDCEAAKERQSDDPADSGVRQQSPP